MALDLNFTDSMYFPNIFPLNLPVFPCVWQLHDAICDPHLHEAPGSEGQGASEPGAEAGPDWFPAKDQGSAGVAPEDWICVQFKPQFCREKFKIDLNFVFQEELGLLSCTANPRAEIGFCIHWQRCEWEIIGIISFISTPEFTLFFSVIKTLREECFTKHNLEPQEALIKALALFTSVFFCRNSPKPSWFATWESSSPCHPHFSSYIMNISTKTSSLWV